MNQNIERATGWSNIIAKGFFLIRTLKKIKRDIDVKLILKKRMLSMKLTIMKMRASISTKGANPKIRFNRLVR